MLTALKDNYRDALQVYMYVEYYELTFITFIYMYNIHLYAHIRANA